MGSMTRSLKKATVALQEQIEISLALVGGDPLDDPHACEEWMRKEIERLADQLHFFIGTWRFRTYFGYRRPEWNPRTAKPDGVADLMWCLDPPVGDARDG
jgi:hypothetical protein